MIQRKTMSPPQGILNHLRSLIAEAEDMLAKTGVPLSEKEIARLKQSFDNGIGRLRDQYSDMEGRVRSYWEDLETSFRDYYEDLERQLIRRLRTTDRSIRRHPYESIGVAFGAGVLIGAILAWRRR